MRYHYTIHAPGKEGMELVTLESDAPLGYLRPGRTLLLRRADGSGPAHHVQIRRIAAHLADAPDGRIDTIFHVHVETLPCTRIGPLGCSCLQVAAAPERQPAAGAVIYVLTACPEAKPDPYDDR